MIEAIVIAALALLSALVAAVRTEFVAKHADRRADEAMAEAQAAHIAAREEAESMGGRLGKILETIRDQLSMMAGANSLLSERVARDYIPRMEVREMLREVRQETKEDIAELMKKLLEMERKIDRIPTKATDR